MQYDHPDSDPTQGVKECNYGDYSPRDEFCFKLDAITEGKMWEIQKRDIAQTDERVKVVKDTIRDTKDYVFGFIRNKIEPLIKYVDRKEINGWEAEFKKEYCNLPEVILNNIIKDTNRLIQKAENRSYTNGRSDGLREIIDFMREIQ